jgi:hypothetical protein
MHTLEEALELSEGDARDEQGDEDAYDRRPMRTQRRKRLWSGYVTAS